ncbi:MAG: NYN domain-containing protein, partial [Candidatus Anstonellales archaeon]
MPCYLLDGYNIINQIEDFSAKTLSIKRELLIKFLIRKKPQGSYKNKVIVVFDGNNEIFLSQHEV